MKKILKVKLAFLTLLFPFTISLIGYLVGMYMENTFLAALYAIVGFVFGFALDYACAYRKIFAILLYQIPFPLTLGLLSFWVCHYLMDTYMSLLASLAGVGLGIWLNKVIIAPYQFYKIKKRILVVMYIFFSISMMGIFLGIPVFNLLLGVLAGNYLSIRVTSYNRNDTKKINEIFIQGSVFTSLTLVALSFLVGWIAIMDVEYSNYLLSHFSISPLNYKTLLICLIICSLGLGIIQFTLTFFTAKTMLSYWQNRKVVN